MIPIILVEPDSTSKRRHFVATLLGPKGIFFHPTLENLKDRLREVRDCSVGHLDSLVDELVSRLTAISEPEFSFAKDATQAIEKITSFASGTLVAVNKSAIVTEGLVPRMVATKPDVVETYCVQSKRFDTDILSH